MFEHKLIFRSTHLPESNDVSKESLASIIKDDATALEYFGERVDRQLSDEYYEELDKVIDSTSFIMFYFDTDQEISYSETDAKQYAIALLAKENAHILSDGKDTDVLFG